MARLLTIFWGTLLAVTAFAADPSCPALAFDTATVLNLKDSEASHTVLVRQSDGSYTAYEVADAAPYAVLGMSPNYPAGLSGCPFQKSTYTTTADTTAVSVRLTSGLIVLAGPYQSFSSVQVRVFDSQFRFISETLYLQRDETDPMASSGVVPQWIEATDIDGDGNSDLLIAGTISAGGGRTRAGVFLLLGDGAGGFRAGNHYDVWYQSYVHMTGLAVADLNQDGIPDLLAAAEDMDGLTGTLFVLLGGGSGAFEEPRTAIKVPRVLTTGLRGVPSVAAHDLNGDGVPDLVFAERTALHVAFGAGDGRFAEAPSLPPLDHPVTIGDVDGDGNPDIVAGGTVLFGDGAGNFPDRRQYLAPIDGRTILTDWNADGKTDILVGKGSADVLVGDQVAILAGREGRNLAASPGMSFPDGVAATVAADFNRDGVPDLAVASGELVHILTAAPDGSLTDVAQYTLPTVMATCQPTALVPADFNGDGVMDLAAAFRCQPRGFYLVVYPGKGDGTLGRKPEILATDPYTQSIGAGDFNGDGIADLVAVNGQPSDTLELFEASGGKFMPPRRYSVGPGARALARSAISTAMAGWT